MSSAYRPRNFNYYKDVSSLPDAASVAEMESSGACSVNIDGKCVANLPAVVAMGCAAVTNVTVNANGTITGCPQKSAIFCADNQPYSADNGWACAVSRQGLSYRGI